MATTRRAFVAAGAGTLAAVALQSRAAFAKDRKPNLLYILADDHAGYVLGVDGNHKAHTPNIDRLANEGVRFANNYCSAPVCTASRQSILTSLYPHAAGVTVLETPLSDDKPTIAKQLAASGYQPAVFGKMHFNRPGAPGLHGFSVACTEDIVYHKWLEDAGSAPKFPEIPTQPPWRPFVDPARVWLNSEMRPWPRTYENMEGTWIAQQAVKYMREHQGTPFALWVSFMEPHSPYKFPIESRNDYSVASFPVPPVGPEDFHQIPLIFRDLTDEQKQGAIASYYTSVEFLDRNIGVVLQALRDLDLENETLVIYMADHGYSLGQHGRFEKHVCYDPALRVPLVFRWPGHISSGTVITDLTESIDVPPTLIQLLGAEPFAVNQGRSMVSYLTDGKSHTRRNLIFSEYLENEEACVRTDRWKFIHCSGRRLRMDGYLTDNPIPGRTIQLFDLQNDPGEYRNVAANHPDIIQELSSEMLAIFRSTHPDADHEPTGISMDDAVEWYLRPRDARPSPFFNC